MLAVEDGDTSARDGKETTYLLVGRKNGKAGAGRLVLLRSSKSPECNGTATELGEPALELGLGGIVGQARHVKNFASLGKKGTNIGSGVHWASQNVGVLLRGLRLANEAAKNSSEGDGLLHGTARRGRGQSLQVKGEVVLDGGAGLNRLDLESGTNVGEHRGTER